MKRFALLFAVWFGIFLVLAGGGPVADAEVAQGAGRPAIQILGLDEVQENNTMKWKIKVLAEGTTLNKVTLDILPKGGKVAFGQPAPLPSGRGHYKPFNTPMVVDGVFEEKGEVKKLPPGGYYVVVIVTYNGNKKIYNAHTPTVTGGVQQPIGEISEEMEFLPAHLLLTNRMKVHGKYTAPAANNALGVKKFTATLITPGSSVKVEDVRTQPEYSHTFTDLDLPALGPFISYVRAEVFNSANMGEPEGWVYTTRHEKKAP